MEYERLLVFLQLTIHGLLDLRAEGIGILFDRLLDYRLIDYRGLGFFTSGKHKNSGYQNPQSCQTKLHDEVPLHCYFVLDLRADTKHFLAPRLAYCTIALCWQYLENG